ncbi:MAG: alpha/beta hydrolase-fold protein [Acidimicrobiales bacterium]
MISRRKLLVGAAGGAAVGAGAATAVGWHRVLRAVGISTGPDAHVVASGLDVIDATFDSAAMGGPVAWSRAVTVDRPEAVVLCLHGKGDDHRFAFDDIHLHDVAAAAAAPVAIVSVDGGEDSYWHRRATGIDPQAMLFDELVPLVTTTLGATLPMYLVGWSMGGYGALLAAETHPDLVAGVCATSPALFLHASDVVPGAFDGPDDYTAHDVYAGVDRLPDDGARVRIDCGSEDPFFTADRRFADLLVDATTAWTDASHDAGYWRSVASAQLRTILDWMG